MASIQQEMVERRVQYIGNARCDICEEMRAECIDFPAGFFGSVRGTVCDTCLSLMLRKCNPKVGGDAV